MSPRNFILVLALISSAASQYPLSVADLGALTIAEPCVADRFGTETLQSMHFNCRLSSDLQNWTVTISNSYVTNDVEVLRPGSWPQESNTFLVTVIHSLIKVSNTGTCILAT